MNKAGRKKSKPEGWREVKLGDVAVFHYGKSLTKQNRVDGDIPVFSSAGLVDFHNKALTDTSGIIIGRKGTAGKVYYSRIPFYCIDTAFYILPSDKYSLEFLFHLLLTLNLDELNEDSAVPGLNRDTAYQQKVFLPPLAEQRAIAEVLSSLDDKIDLLHRQNKTLEDMAQTIFRQRFIEEANGEWEEKSLDRIAEYLNGLACQKYPPKNEKDKLPVLKIKELSGGISEGTDWVSSEIDKKYIIELGDVIFSWSGSLMVKIWTGEKCVLNQHLFKITSENYPKWFYYFWTKRHLKKFIQIAESKTTTMGHIKRGDLSNSVVLVPTSSELQQIDEEITPLFEKIISNHEQIGRLEKLRDILLPKLVGGKVSVKL